MPTNLLSDRCRIREIERERKREREREEERASDVCVCVCVCDRVCVRESKRETACACARASQRMSVRALVCVHVCARNQERFIRVFCHQIRTCVLSSSIHLCDIAHTLVGCGAFLYDVFARESSRKEP